MLIGYDPCVNPRSLIKIYNLTISDHEDKLQFPLPPCPAHPSPFSIFWMKSKKLLKNETISIFGWNKKSL